MLAYAMTILQVQMRAFFGGYTTPSFERALQLQETAAGQKQTRTSTPRRGYLTELITLEIGSKGLVDESELNNIRAALDTTRTEVYNLALQLGRAAVQG